MANLEWMSMVFSLRKSSRFSSKPTLILGGIFFSEVSDAPTEAYLGEASSQPGLQGVVDDQSEQGADSRDQLVSVARNTTKIFVIYQLSNSLPPNGSGVGCGHYDEYQDGDNSGIARLMNKYVFGVCFNPEIHEDNIFHFLDYCLSHLSNSFFSDIDKEGYTATKAALPGGLDPKEMGMYWKQYRSLVHQQVQNIEERYVNTFNYIASYHEDLPSVFAVLDELADEATAVAGNSDELPQNPS
jgi:hypothetical protein